MYKFPQVLQKKFDDFVRDLSVSEERINNINTIGSKLTGMGHSKSNEINKRCEEINHMWREVKELAQARQEALAGAKLVSFWIYNWGSILQYYIGLVGVWSQHWCCHG